MAFVLSNHLGSDQSNQNTKTTAVTICMLGRHPYHGSSPKHSKIFLCEVPMFPLALINQMSTFCHEPGETI